MTDTFSGPFVLGLAYGLSQLTHDAYGDFTIYENEFDPEAAEAYLAEDEAECRVTYLHVIHIMPDHVYLRVATTEAPTPLPSNWKTRP